MEILENCSSLNDVARKIFGKANYTNREKCKKILLENGIDWKEWLESIKLSKTKYCIVCGKKLEKSQVKFCSHSCSATFNNSKRNKKNEIVCDSDGRVIQIKKYCEYCGKELNSNQDRFCSNKCQKDNDHLLFVKRWKNGDEDGINGEYGISKHIRRYLMEKNNCKCEICGWSKTNNFTGTIPLEIHHIDGNYKNNKEENLQLLCPNCHSLTEFTKSHNKNGRKGRKKYDKKPD